MKMYLEMSVLVLLVSACNQVPAVSDVNGAEVPVIAEVTPTPVPGQPATPPPVVKNKTIALIYEGTGSCAEDCSKASAESAKMAGFTPVMVGPKAIDANSPSEKISALFSGAAIWVQPGGYAREAYNAMTPTLRNALIDFIKNGGGYVGFCAGAFITTKIIGSTSSRGLGIFPGNTAPLGTGSSREVVKWNGKSRSIYFEGGPYMYNIDKNVEVTAYYDDGRTVASARTTYGKGRVYITGPHPEAPEWWNGSKTDPDGSDRDLAVEMMKWAAFQ